MDQSEFLLPFPLHAKQDEFVQAALSGRYRIIAAYAGKSWGKSLSGAIILGALVVRNWDLQDAAYIAAAPNYKTMQGGMMQSFLQVFGPLELGKFNKNDMVYTLKNSRKGRMGHRIYFRSLNSDNALEGINNVRGIWADEAGQYAYPGWQNLRHRASLRKAPIWITTTPYGLGPMYKEIYLPWQDNTAIELWEGNAKRIVRARDFMHVVQGNSWENPVWEEDAALQRRILGKEEFERAYTGNFQQLQGLVYTDFHPVANVFDERDWEDIFGSKYPEIPKHVKITAGVDWGSSDGNPFAVAIVAYTPNGYSYQIDEVLRDNLSATDMINILSDKQGQWGIQSFCCDRDPKMVEDMGRRGMTAVGTDKTAGINYGINRHKALIRSRTRKIFKQCQYSISAYQTYAWRKYANPEKAPQIRPSHVMSDLMDANRYDMLANSDHHEVQEVRAPFVPAASGETEAQGVSLSQWEQYNDANKRIERVVRGDRDRPGKNLW